MAPKDQTTPSTILQEASHQQKDVGSPLVESNKHSSSDSSSFPLQALPCFIFTMLWSTKSVTLLCLATSRAVHAFPRTTAASNRALHATALKASAAPPTQYMLTYDYIPDVLEKRGPFRAEHLQLAGDMAAAGTCIAGGPYAPAEGLSPTGALFVFDTKAAAEEFVAKDPYVSGGIVTAHRIHAWTVAVQKES